MPHIEGKLSKKERKLAKQRKNEELKCLRILEYLDREIKFGNVSRRKHERSWRELLTKTRLKTIRDDLEYTWQVFEWALDIKDLEISKLMDELNDVSHQYSISLQNHNMVIQHLLHNMNEDQKSMYDDFSLSLKNMKRYHHEQHEQYKENYGSHLNSMKVVLYRMETNYDKYFKDQISRFFCMLESFTSTENERESYEEMYGRKMRKLWYQSTRILDELILRCGSYASDFEKDQLAVEFSEGIIRKNVKKISYFTEVLKTLKAKISSLYDREGETLREITTTHGQLSMCLFILKDKLFKDKIRDTNQRKLIVCTSEAIMEQLRRILRIGELLLRRMSLNRRYEAASEQVRPFPVLKYYWKSPLPSLNPALTKDKLFLFHQKIAIVEASRFALIEEKKVLQLERMQMKRKLENFCGCFSCTGK